MADLSRKTASIYIDSEPAKIALQNLNIQADKLTVSIAKGQAAGKAMVGEISKLDKVNTQIAGVQKQIDSGLRPSFNQLTTAAAQANAELKKLSQDDPGYAQKVAQVKALKAELGNLSGQIQTVKQNSEAFGGSFIAIFERAAEYLTAYAIISGLTKLIKGTVDAAIEAEVAVFRFKGTLDNLGRTDAFNRLSASAQKLHDQFAFFGKPEIIGVFEQLVTFGKLSEDQINELTPVIINFAAKSGQSLKESTTTILAALEGNGKGLKQYGINIKDAKTEAERFGVIMDQLGPKVNGAAAAFGETTQGAIEKTQIRFKELQEEIGNKLLPTLNNLLQGFNALIDDLSKDGLLKGTLKVVGNTVQGIQVYLFEGYQALKKYQQFRKDVINGIVDEEGNKIAQLIQPADGPLVSKDANKAFDGGKGLSTTEKEKHLKDESALLKEYLKKDQEQINLFNKQELEGARDAYAALYSNQDKSENDRLDSLKNFYLASEKLIALDEKGKLDSLKVQEGIDLKKAGEITNVALREKTITAIVKTSNDTQANIKADAIRAQQDLDIKFAKTSVDIVHDGYLKEEKELADHIAALKQLQKEKIAAATDQVDISANTHAIDLLDAFQTQMDKAHGQKRIDLENELQRKLTEIDKNAALAKLEIQEGDLEKTLILDNLYEESTTDVEAKITDNKRKQAELRKGITDDEAKHEQKVQAERLELATAIISSAQQLAGILTSINDAKNAQDEAQIAQNDQLLTDSTTKLDRELANKVLSQKEYDRQLKALQDKKTKDDNELKKKEFERDKEASIIQAIISGAQAVVSTLAARPGFTDIVSLGTFRAINIALAVATTAAEIATISSQKAPTLARGGLLDGPSHSQGGMPVINPATGRKVAEVEGGEPFLSRKTYANNRELVDQLLQASMYRNGARIIPYWQQRSYQPFNYTGVTRTIERIRQYERGGVFATSAGDSSVVNNTSTPFPPELMDTLNAINIKLGLPVKSYVVVTDVNAANAVLDQIKKDTTIKRT